MAGSAEKSFRTVMDALNELCSSDEHTYTGSSLTFAIVEQTGLSRDTVRKVMTTLVDLGVVSSRKPIRWRPSEAAIYPRKAIYQWTLLLPDAEVVKDKGGFYGLAED